MLDTSPYQSEITSSFKQGIPIPRMYQKYAPLIGYTAKSTAFYQLVRKHVIEKHKIQGTLIPNTGSTRTATIENFGQAMLSLGMAKIDTMTPETVQLKDVISAQKLVLDSKKLKISEESMILMMGKLFGPSLKGEVIEGEVSAA